MNSFVPDTVNVPDHFEALFKHATMGILITDSRGVITAANPFVLKEFGYLNEELVGQKIEILIPARLRKDHAAHHEQYFKKPATRQMGMGAELYAITRDGTEIPVEISLSYYSQNRAHYVIAFINNISVRKKAEAEIRKLNDDLELTVAERTHDLTKTLQQLEEANLKLQQNVSFQQALLQHAGALIFTTDEEGIIQSFNQEAENELGYCSHELIHKKNILAFHVKEELERRAVELSASLNIPVSPNVELLFLKAKRGLHNEYEWNYVRKDGTRFPVSLNITALRDEQGLITGFLGIGMNVTEHKKTEMDLQTALAREKELNELKSRFVSTASHEFRTPLSTVLSSAYLIEKYDQTADHPKRQKHLERIISSVSMLTSILDDFLSVGKIEEGKIHLKLVELNVPDFINTVASEMQDTSGGSRIIETSHEGETEFVTDPGLLKHILLNLLSNAIKFSPPGSPILVRTRLNNSQFELSVKDFGMGIPQEDQKHLAERFYRGSNVSNIKGTGLGLHIVNKYAELINGRMQWQSELDKGSEFIITIHSKPQ